MCMCLCVIQDVFFRCILVSISPDVDHSRNTVWNCTFLCNNTSCLSFCVGSQKEIFGNLILHWKYYTTFSYLCYSPELFLCLTTRNRFSCHMVGRWRIRFASSCKWALLCFNIRADWVIPPASRGGPVGGDGCESPLPIAALLPPSRLVLFNSLTQDQDNKAGSKKRELGSGIYIPCGRKRRRKDN